MRSHPQSPSGLADLAAPWGRHTLPDEGTLPLRIGPRELWFAASEGEVWIGHAEAPPPGTDEPEHPLSPEPPSDSGMQWSRWATPHGEREIELRPAFPDRPLVLTPERSFRLLPRAEARVYVRVPLWIRIELRQGDGEPGLFLEETPALAMSDTWWGDFMEGELTYWLPTTARRQMRPDLHLAHLGVCPLQMVNRSDDDLEVQKLAFRVPHLSLFAEETGRFWGDETRVTYRGESEGSDIDISGRPPAEAEGARRAALPRSPLPRGFRARTFQRLRVLPGMGGA